MSVIRRAALPALVSFYLAGCAGVPHTQALSREIVPALQPVDVQVGVKQPELYAAFVPSQVGAGAAAACGAVPGLGVLLAGVCGGTLGAIDASVNASRAKDSEALAQPLKDALVDVHFDQGMTDALRQSLSTVPGLQLAGVKLTKNVDDKAYMATFRASEAGALLYVNIDYHISADFSTLEVSARGLLFPRSADARKAAKLPAEVPATDQVLLRKDAAYRMDVIYQARLPAQAGAAPTVYREGWLADGGRLLRGSLDDGIRRVGQTLADDLGHNAAAPSPVLRKVTAPTGVAGDLLAEQDGAQLVRAANGTLYYLTAAVAQGAAPNPVVPVAGAATATTPSQP